MIGKYFSNGWKYAAGFSNDWQNLPAVFQRLEKFSGASCGNTKDKKGNKRRGGRDVRQL
jgi:hypothetical protein